MALLFHAVVALGLMVFAIVLANTWSRAAASGALFGFFAYATYDLTNLATLRDWPVAQAMLGIAWRSLVSAVSAVAGKLAMDRFGAA